MEMKNVRVVGEGLRFPEGPVALDDGSVVVVEMLGGALTRVDRQGKKSLVARIGGGPNGAQLGPDGALYVCNNGGFKGERGGIDRVDMATGKFERIYETCGEHRLAAPNDLVFDETGHFWFTDFRGGAIYYAAPDGSDIRRMITDVMDPNGIGLSPDLRTLYWAQTHTRQVMRRPLAAPGELVPMAGYGIRALFETGQMDMTCLVAGLPGAQELDSLAVTASGAVCVGTLIESGITVFSPDGQTERHTLPAELQDRIVTNICFGGPDLRTAFITCSETGRLVACDWPEPGLKLQYP